jgi:hypothetical protein
MGAELVRAFIRPVYEVLWALLREALPEGADEAMVHLIGFSIVGQCFYHRVGRHVVRSLAGEEEFAGYHAQRLADHIASFSLAALGLESPISASLPMARRRRKQS